MIIQKKKIFQILIQLIITLIPSILSDINIHIIPHTHLDPGWLMTPEDYYSQERIEDIFNTVLRELTSDPKKTFVINEIYYFKIWYSRLTLSQKRNMQKLVESKRVEFVSGSYVVNDEATPLYYNIMDQIRIGHQFLLEEFGITPKTGWYIDSFGHSAGNAFINAQMNFENLVLGRMHKDYLELMKDRKMTEFYWEPFGSSSNKKILTHVLPIHYGYDLFMQNLGAYNDEFIGNIRMILDDLISHFELILKGIKHKNIMFLYGDDFRFKDEQLFLNIDSLIKSITNNTYERGYSRDELKIRFGKYENINIFYSTPEKYFAYVKRDLSQKNEDLITFSNKDFYPLRDECFWTGYFTSRPYLKGNIRKASNVFYSLSKYFAFNKFLNEEITKDMVSSLDKLRDAVGLTQHHDAITGTCTQGVSSYYINKLNDEINNAESLLSDTIQDKYQARIGPICYNNFIVYGSESDKDCSNNFVISDDSEDQKIKIGIYNPIFTTYSKVTSRLINIEILNSEFEYEIEGVKSDFFCVSDQLIDLKLFNYKNKCYLNFFYDFSHEEEFIFITIKRTTTKIMNEKYFKFKKGGKIKLVENGKNIKNLILNPKNFEFNLEYYNEDQEIIKLNFTYYDGMYYVNAGSCTDGAYIFSPYNKYPDRIKIDYNNSFYYMGQLGISIVTRNKHASFTIFTIFYNPFFIKVEHIFDRMENNYFLKRFSFGYSFVLKTSINNLDKDNKPVFYTDSNGVEVIKRTIDRFEYTESDFPFTAGNFYPVTSFMSIEDENKNKVTVFNDRAQAGTGYVPGSLIFVLQRMTYGMDNKGMQESLNDKESMNTDSFKTVHLIFFGNSVQKDGYKGSKYEKNMYQKTDLINLAYSYLNTGTFMFKIFKNDKSKGIEKAIMEKNKLIKEKIYNYLKTSPDIRANYEVINDKLIIGEYFRYHNYFFDKNSENDKNDKIFGSITLDFKYDTNFKIYYDKTGINYNKNGDKVKEGIKLMEPKGQSFSLDKNEFLYIYFYFN